VLATELEWLAYIAAVSMRESDRVDAAPDALSARLSLALEALEEEGPPLAQELQVPMA